MATKCIFICVLLILFFVGTSQTVFAQEKKTKKGNTELLIVIDNSGSMKETEKFLKEAISLINVLTEMRSMEVDITYMTFNEMVFQSESALDIVYVSGKETCIIQGICAADEWVDNKISEGTNVKVLFISDLFSSCYIQEGKMCKYDIEIAKSEQEEIDEIESRWKKWCKDGKASVVVWTWASFCSTENVINTIEYIEKHEEADIKKGYQVDFNPWEKERFNPLKMDNEEEFIKMAIKSYEKLMNSAEIEWENYWAYNIDNVIKETDDEEKVIYFYFPGENDVEIKSNGIRYNPQIEGLYILPGKGNKYNVRWNSRSSSTTERRSGFILVIPDVKWEIDFLPNILSANEKFTITLFRGNALSGSREGENIYDCKLTVESINNDENVLEYVLEYQNGVFLKSDLMLEAGKYNFIFEVDGEVVAQKEKRVN